VRISWRGHDGVVVVVVGLIRSASVVMMTMQHLTGASLSMEFDFDMLRSLQ